MSDDISEKIVSKIRKLMAMANGNAEGGEHERDTALKMALNLLAKHNLSMADVKEKDKEGRKTEEFEMASHAWAKFVINAVAQMLFCKIFTTKIGKSTDTKMRVTFIGRESNVITAKEMSLYIIKSITREAARKAKETGQAGAFQRSFCNGAGTVVSLRCMELRRAEEEASKATPGTGLVLASLYAQELAANDQYVVAVMGVKLVTKPLNPKSKSTGGHEAGVAFGKKINLNKQIQ